MRASALRQQIEQTLSRRAPGALSPQPRCAPDLLAIGIGSLDDLLRGGLPRGAISELVGPESSGRTSSALSFLAARLREGEVGAWIDASNNLNPESAAAAGVSLERLLWVRCGCLSSSTQPLEKQAHAIKAEKHSMGLGGVSVDRSIAAPSQSGGCGSPHPRSEGRGMQEALQNLMSEPPRVPRAHPGNHGGLLPPRRRDRSIGTPSAPNRTPDSGSAVQDDDTEIRSSSPALQWRSVDREEQVATDRRPARRGDHLADRLARTGSWTTDTATGVDGPRCAEPQQKQSIQKAPARYAGAAETRSSPARIATPTAFAANSPVSDGSAIHVPCSAAATTFFKGQSLHASALSPQPTNSSLRGIDQALRAVDLLLQSGGFGVIILDLGAIAPEIVWRIPLATWFRFRAGAARARTSLVLLTQHACARSSAELVLEMQNGRILSSGNVMTGISYAASIGRQRFSADPDPVPNVVPIRKPPQPECAARWNGQAAWMHATALHGSALDQQTRVPHRSHEPATWARRSR